MGTWLNILSNSEYQNIGKNVVKDERFQIDENESIYCHLETMYNKHVELTDKIICGGEEVIFGNEVEILIDLLYAEKEKLDKIFLDEWEFHKNPKILKTINDKKITQNDFNPTKAYLAERTMSIYEYEIRFGKLGTLELRTEKKWMRISKNEIKEHISNYLKILADAKENNEYLFFTYW